MKLTSEIDAFSIGREKKNVIWLVTHLSGRAVHTRSAAAAHGAFRVAATRSTRLHNSPLQREILLHRSPSHVAQRVRCYTRWARALQFAADAALSSRRRASLFADSLICLALEKKFAWNFTFEGPLRARFDLDERTRGEYGSVLMASVQNTNRGTMSCVREISRHSCLVWLSRESPSN